MGNMVKKIFDELGLLPSEEHSKQIVVALSFMFAVRLVRWTV